jgi:hypothetical protein
MKAANLNVGVQRCFHLSVQIVLWVLMGVFHEHLYGVQVKGREMENHPCK